MYDRHYAQFTDTFVPDEPEPVRDEWDLKEYADAREEAWDLTFGPGRDEVAQGEEERREYEAEIDQRWRTR